MDVDVLKKIKLVLLIIASITLIICIPLSKKADKARAHDIDDISVVITDCSNKMDDRNYYVYTEFTVTNNTSATLEYVEVVTYFKDSNGKTIGKMTSSLGESFGTGMNLAPGEKTIEETYLSERITSGSFSDLFVELYNHGLENVVITHKITSGRWSDGYSATGKE